MTSPYVPLPVDEGYCTACRANVRLDGHGRCACGVLAIWLEGWPRPATETDTLLKLLAGGRMDPASSQGVKRRPLNVRQLRGTA